jgi:hypothetical protein
MSSVFFLTNRAERIDEIDALVALTTPELRARHRLSRSLQRQNADASHQQVEKKYDEREQNRALPERFVSSHSAASRVENSGQRQLEPPARGEGSAFEQATIGHEPRILGRVWTGELTEADGDRHLLAIDVKPGVLGAEQVGTVLLELELGLATGAAFAAGSTSMECTSISTTPQSRTGPSSIAPRGCGRRTEARSISC